MISLLKRRLGIPGLISIIALVFALGGGAWAASKYKITSTSQIKPSVLKKLKGSRGPAGPAGAQGLPGVPGPKGDTGAAGKDGTNGVNVSSAAAALDECPAGGTKFTAASGTSKVCNGEEGSPWTAGGTLPAGQTLTGTWAGSWKENDLALVPIEFQLPIEPAPTPTLVTGASATGCPGIVNEVPTADPGNLCVYMSLEAGGQENAAFLKPTSNSFTTGASPTGTVFSFLCKSPSCFRTGVWAATAEE
ncbi:MAG TPA: hypothetical protein VKB23_09370 [Solirubrobacterales bacterium]|nr:hypothetical protein [Solirubrobacterales bacterium]